MTKRTSQLPALLTLPVAAKRLGLTVQAVKRLIDCGELRAVEFGGETRRHLRILRQSLETFLHGGNGHAA